MKRASSDLDRDCDRDRDPDRDRNVDLGALVQHDQVHRDVYTDPRVFALEMRRLWSRAWLFVGLESQVPEPGDYRLVTLAGESMLFVRHGDGTVHVLANRCAHKGTPLVSEPAGNLGRVIRCPYHAWTYATDGALRGRPLPQGYAGSRVDRCDAARGLGRAGAVATHRGFVFARLAAEGASFDEAVPPAMRAVLDNMADRSPLGRLRVAGGVIRSRIACNWKVYLENVNDTVHPPSTHESASASAEQVAAALEAGAPRPMALQALLPFASGYRYFDEMGGRVFAGGHSILGTRHSVHSGYAGLEDYAAALRAAHGEARTAEILSFSPQNAVFYPGLAVKAQPLILRVLRPVAVDCTELEAWALEAEGAPPELLRRSVLYNRLVFSPMSVLAHDDLHVFEGIQRALRSEVAPPWVSLHRGAPAAGDAAPHAVGRDVGGTDEALIRNQFAAWAALTG